MGIPLQLVLDYVDNLLGQHFNPLTAQVDREAGLEVVADSAGLGCLGLVLVCDAHRLPRQRKDLAGRQRAHGRQIGAGGDISEARYGRRRGRCGCDSSSGDGWIVGQAPRAVHRHHHPFQSRFLALARTSRWFVRLGSIRSRSQKHTHTRRKQDGTRRVRLPFSGPARQYYCRGLVAIGGWGGGGRWAAVGC